MGDGKYEAWCDIKYTKNVLMLCAYVFKKSLHFLIIPLQNYAHVFINLQMYTTISSIKE